MNQILVTEKLYITPEVKKKKTRYKIMFFISIVAMCSLFSYYVYAEYNKDKSEEVSKRILAQISSSENTINTEDNTVKNIVNDVLIVSLDAKSSDAAQNDIQDTITLPEEINEDEDESYVDEDSGLSYTTEAILRIDSLGINYPILSQTSEELLKISLNKYWGPKPNTVGNYCIVGHNYRNGKMFGKLSEIGIGDTTILEDMTGKAITYEVYDRYVVEPTDVSCTSQLTGGKKELTLITCTNYGTQRLIVKCREI